MGLFERIGRRTAKKETYEAMSSERRYGFDTETPEVGVAREQALKEAAYNGAFFQLQMKVTSNLLKSLRKGDPEGNADVLKKEIDERIGAFKKAPSESALQDLQEWTLAKTHADFLEPVSRAFGDLREDLIRQGIELG